MFLVGLSWARPLGNSNNKGNSPRNSNNCRRGGNTPNDDNNDDTLSQVKVCCRAQWYELQQVTTVGDLLQQVQQQSASSLTSRDLHTAKLLYRGKVLDNRNDKLKDYGIRNGDTIFVVPENYRFKAHEALAIFLEMMAKEDNNSNKNMEDDSVPSPLAKLFAHFQEQGLADYFRSWDDLLLHVHRDEIKHVIRTEVDLAYHRLRMLWEKPTFRQALANPGAIEAYRQVLASHLPPSIQKDLPPTTKQVLHNPQIWQKHVLRWTEGFLRFGDLVLDSLLDIVLDVVQGAGQSTTSALSSQFTSSRTSSSQQQPPHDHYQPTMEDPTMANQMLFELSESEDN